MTMWCIFFFFFFFDSHIFIPVSGIIYNPVERAYPTLRALQTNAGLPIPGHMNTQGWERYFIVLCADGTS